MNKLAKTGLYSLGGIVILLLVLLGATQLASERVEVVELHTVDDSGQSLVTRLWLVDDEGFQYLRAGSPGSGWYGRIKASTEIELTRNGETRRYTTVDRPDKREHINQLMKEKYTWGDDFMSAVAGSRNGATPVELHPLN